MVKPQNVYEMEGRFKGKRLWIIAPGPTFAGYMENRAITRRDPIIAINSAIELINHPTLWLYSDRKIGQIYDKEIRGRTVSEIVVTTRQSRGVASRFRGKRLWVYNYQMKILRRIKNAVPPWYCPPRRFLPGRCSVFNIAVSLAWLLKPERVIFVGVDFSIPEGKYYFHGVKKNGGPLAKERNLAAGLNFFKGLRRKNMWPGLKMETTSPYFAKKTGVVLRKWSELE